MLGHAICPFDEPAPGPIRQYCEVPLTFKMLQRGSVDEHQGLRLVRELPPPLAPWRSISLDRREIALLIGLPTSLGGPTGLTLRLHRLALAPEAFQI